jgi:leucyl aminopeptidase (aminopeptidase T)
VADDTLALAAQTTVERLGTTEDDRFAVVFNDELRPIADAIAAAAAARTRHVLPIAFPTLTRNGEEPPDDVAEVLLAADAAAIVTTYSLSHTRARLAATNSGARVASMPGITVEMFARTLPTDYGYLETRGRELAEQLTAAERCRITAPGGTDVELVLDGRRGLSDDGDLRAPGAFGNLPAGEAYISPYEQEGEGTIVFDASVATIGLLAEPLRVEFSGGRAVAAAGGEAASALLALLDAGGPNGRNVAELGIGTNPAATITGRILEDEKAERTVHIAFGTNTGIGGENQASVHIDGVIHDPTVALDGREIMRDGKLL